MINTFVKVIVELLPLVKLLPSGTVVADILIPGFVFKIVKLPKTKPVLISVDVITTSLDETTVVTVNSALKVLEPLFADNNADPITSPTFIFEISNEPTLDVYNAESISTSPASWLTDIVKSAKLSQSVFDNEIKIAGEKSVWA